MAVVDIALLAAAISWLTTALVYKDGPFHILLRFRHFVNNRLGSNSPLTCAFCSSFWIGLVVVTVYCIGNPSINAIIQLFGIIGFAVTLRGMSGIWE